ncbi:MAG: sterol desaturase family protein [Betaproteobacteria bacterium]|nr:MAG: sterol desaturase family protein [Betaproteobacteria bacterium]
MKAFIARNLYGLVVAGSVSAFALARAWGLSLEGVVLAASVATLLVAALLERVMPFDAAWNEPQGDTSTDAFSAAVLIGLVDPALKALMPVFALSLLRGLDAPWQVAALDAPFVLQVIAALLWIELAKYLSHRWHHRSPSLWWLHALHHGSRRLYWLNNFRFHPLNHAINSLASVLPLWLIGVPVDVLLAVAAITQPVVMLQHANIDLRSGVLNYVFSTNEVHRWHHSSEPSEANANFGSALVLWDQLFGTYRHRPGADRPRSVGLFGNGSGYPAARSYVGQLMSMFRPDCCRA